MHIIMKKKRQRLKKRSSTKEPRTDWDKLARIPDGAIDVSDVPELDEEFFREAKLRLPKGKQSVSLRLDSDVVDWFKRQEKGYQTKINAVLRAYVRARSN